jgi:sphingomyelin phosphodiesterase
LATNDIFGNNTCAICQAGLEVAQFLALAAPSEVPTLMVTLCDKFNFSSTSGCAETYGITGYGAFITQVLANADVGGYDGQVCAFGY